MARSAKHLNVDYTFVYSYLDVTRISFSSSNISVSRQRSFVSQILLLHLHTKKLDYTYRVLAYRKGGNYLHGSLYIALHNSFSWRKTFRRKSHKFLCSQFDFLTTGDFNDDERIVNRATLRGSFENFDR